MSPTGASRRAPVALAAGALALGLSTAGLVAGVEPVPTWYYPLAWYPTLLIADAIVALREGRFFLLSRPAFAAGLLAWSVPFWLFFELVNLRLENWYYVFVPDARLPRWTGIALSYATVLPAILLSERLLRSLGIARGLGIARLSVGPRLLAGLQAVGVAMLVLALAWPRGFFPLVWGSVTLIVDPWVHRRDPDRSLIGELRRGRAGRVVRLLLGGLAIGLVWEILNTGARGRWIYTVPGLEDLKLFEMPVLGFLGFPVFALDGYVTWRALELAGLAVPVRGRPRPAPGWARVSAAVGAAAFSALVLTAMERGTIASTSPRLEDVPGVPAERLEPAGFDVFALAGADPGAVSRRAGVDVEEARAWVEAARLVALRGIGTEGAAALAAVGVRTVEDLAARDAGGLARDLAATGHPVPPARVRVWVRAAREAVGGGPAGGSRRLGERISRGG